MSNSFNKFLYLSLYLSLVLSFSDAASEPEYAPNRVLVRFTSAPSFGRSTATFSDLGISFLSSPVPLGSASRSTATDQSTSGTFVFSITDGGSVTDKIAALNALDQVAIAEPDYAVSVSALPSDPKFPNQYHHTKMGSSAAWDSATGSTTVKVCVIDSGARTDHPDLADNIIKGWNVVPVTPGGPIPSSGSADFNNYNDTLGHGTHVAGIVGAVGDNGVGVAGVAWRVGLLVCRFIDSTGVGYMSDAITCIRLCRGEGATVYTSSWGGAGNSQSLLAEIKTVEENNGIFVVAAGNNEGRNLDTAPLYPASYALNNLIAVAATDKNDALAAFSNIGAKSVLLAAPGQSILSTTWDGGYGEMSGTSMAAPMVAGAVALLQDVARSAGATLSPAVVQSILSSSSDAFAGGEGTVACGGRLNVARALEALQAHLSQAEATQPEPEVDEVEESPSPSPSPVSSPPPPKVRVRPPPFLKKRKRDTGRRMAMA